MIIFACSQCGKSLKVRDDAAGKRGKCPHCGATLRVPESDSVTLEAADPVRPKKGDVAAETSDPLPGIPGTQRHRRWVAILFLGALTATTFAPSVALWLGVLLIAFCAAAFVPRLQGFARHHLRLRPGESRRNGLRLAMYGLAGAILIFSGTLVMGYRAVQAEGAARRATEEAEQQRRTDEANSQVATLVREADEAWRANNSSLASEKLSAAARVPGATDLAPIQTLRTHMGNAAVEILLLEAGMALRGGDLHAAGEKTQAALAVEHASALAKARELNEQIRNATDSDRMRAIMVDLADEAFERLQYTGEMPEALLTDYDRLNAATSDLANSLVAEVAADRARRKEAQLERELAEAEAARKVAEERMAREAAAAEAKQIEARKRRIERGFRSWDGSHIELTKLIKESMNDPRSYEHDKTVYWDMGDHLIVTTSFRGKNAFGGVVRNWVKAKVDLDGAVIAVIEQGQ